MNTSSYDPPPYDPNINNGIQSKGTLIQQAVQHQHDLQLHHVNSVIDSFLLWKRYNVLHVLIVGCCHYCRIRKLADDVANGNVQIRMIANDAIVIYNDANVWFNQQVFDLTEINAINQPCIDTRVVHQQYLAMKILNEINSMEMVCLHAVCV